MLSAGVLWTSVTIEFYDALLCGALTEILWRLISNKSSGDVRNHSSMGEATETLIKVLFWIWGTLSKTNFIWNSWRSIKTKTDKFIAQFREPIKWLLRRLAMRRGWKLIKLKFGQSLSLLTRGRWCQENGRKFFQNQRRADFLKSPREWFHFVAKVCSKTWTLFVICNRGVDCKIISSFVR